MKKKKCFIKRILMICLFLSASFLFSSCNKQDPKETNKEETNETPAKNKPIEEPIVEPEEDPIKEPVKENQIVIEDPIEDPVEELKSDAKKSVLTMENHIQENNFYCGPAITATILSHFNIYKSQEELADELVSDPVTGTEYVDLARVLNHYIFQNENPSIEEGGYHVQTLPLHSQNEDLKSQWQRRMIRNINDGYPSVLAIDLQKLYPEQGRANHFVICMGYLMEKDQVTRYYILDPYYGVQDPVYGGLKYYTPNEIWNALVENVEPAYIW